MFVGQHPERRRQVVGPLDRDLDPLAVGLHLGLVGDLLGQRHDVEALHIEPVHAALEFRDRIEVIDDVDQTVDAFLGTLEVLAVDQLILQTAVQQGRDIALHVEDRGFQLVRHIAQILLAEVLGLLQAGDLPIVRVGPGRQLLADVLDLLVLEFGEDLVGMHVAREDDRIDRLELVGHILADDEQRNEHHGREGAQQHDDRCDPADLHPLRLHRKKQPGRDGRGQQADPDRCGLLGFDRNHGVTSCSCASDGRCTCPRCRIRGSRPTPRRCGRNSYARTCRG